MGFRTVVILNNDRAHEWEKDANLGSLICQSMHGAGSSQHQDVLAHRGYGHVVECTHADTQTLAVIDSLNFQPAAYSHWTHSDETVNELKVKLLKQAAEQLGFRLVKKSRKGA